MKFNEKNIAVIIPAYNEELTIAGTLRDFHEFLPGACFYVVNNSSTDRTEACAAEVYRHRKIRGQILKEGRKGKALAVRHAFQSISADIFVMVDADCTYKAVDLRKLMEPILNGSADMVVGDRHKNGDYRQENKRRFHNIGNILVRRIINFLFRAKLNDILSGYRVMSRKFIKNFPILSAGFELETEITIHALDKRFRILEIPVEYHDRPAGSFSKLNTISDGLKVIRTIFWIFKYYRPALFFSSVALFFLLGGFVFGMPVILEFYHTGFVRHVPLAILSTGLMLMSLISFAIGLILDSIAKFHKFDFELKLYKVE